MSKPLIFAHRGVKGTHPENTMIAFQKLNASAPMELSLMSTYQKMVNLS